MLLYDPMRIGTLLDERGADGLLAASPRHVRYLTRFPQPGGTLALVLRELADRAHSYRPLLQPGLHPGGARRDGRGACLRRVRPLPFC